MGESRCVPKYDSSIPSSLNNHNEKYLKLSEKE